MLEKFLIVSSKKKKKRKREDQETRDYLSALDLRLPSGRSKIHVTIEI